MAEDSLFAARSGDFDGAVDLMERIDALACWQTQAGPAGGIGGESVIDAAEAVGESRARRAVTRGLQLGISETLR